MNKFQKLMDALIEATPMLEAEERLAYNKAEELSHLANAAEDRDEWVSDSELEVAENAEEKASELFRACGYAEELMLVLKEFFDEPLY